MGIAQRARDSIRNIWSHGDEDDFDRERALPRDRYPDADPEDDADEDAYDVAAEAPRHEPPAAPPTRGEGGGRRVSPPIPLRVSPHRGKQIFTLKPRGLEEASEAADSLKRGSAVVINLDDVDRLTAVRVIDFMSGVCYGLSSQGHAMKLGDTIFLFTPGDFEIAGGEDDYNENPDFFFRDVPAVSALEPHAPDAPAEEKAAEGPIIERTIIGRPGAASERVAIDRPSVAPRAWEK